MLKEVHKMIDSLMSDMNKDWINYIPENLGVKQAEYNTLVKVKGAIELIEQEKKEE